MLAVLLILGVVSLVAFAIAVDTVSAIRDAKKNGWSYPADSDE